MNRLLMKFAMLSGTFLLSFPIVLGLPATAQNVDATKLFKNLEPSVVLITTEKGIGSGVVISSDGLILTNFHVANTRLKMTVEALVEEKGQLVRRIFPDSVLFKIHATNDLALVKVNANGCRFAKARLATAEADAQAGGTCYAMGFPYIPGQEKPVITITKGIISSTSRKVDDVSYLQLDAAINPGNSGGALVNEKGVVIGIPTKRYQGAESIGLATPVAGIKMDQFKAAEEPFPAAGTGGGSGGNASGGSSLVTIPPSFTNVPGEVQKVGKIISKVVFVDGVKAEMMDAPSGVVFNKEQKSLEWTPAPYSKIAEARVLFLLTHQDGSEEILVHVIPRQ